MTPAPLGGTLEAALAAPHAGVTLHWLGQAGFLLRLDDRVVLIDPYLSDSLRAKYEGRGPFSHARLAPQPIAPDAIPRVDLVLCTHRHTDHMDGDTLRPLAARHPACRFVVPAAERAHAAAIGLPVARIHPAVAGTPITDALPGLAIHPVQAAHEAVEQDADGHDRFLGYGLAVDGGPRLYHSGDCVPFTGLVAAVAALRADLALLPVNGRDATRAAAGVPGNFTLDEACALCAATGIPDMVAHHWGTFAFNTADPATIDARAAAGGAPRVWRPDTAAAYRLG